MSRICYPSLVEFIDNIGLAHLHNMHNRQDKDISFNDFVVELHSTMKNEWIRRMESLPKIDLDESEIMHMSPEGKAAVNVFKCIFNSGVRNPYHVGGVIRKDKNLESHNEAIAAMDIFCNTIVPAVKKVLKEIG